MNKRHQHLQTCNNASKDQNLSLDNLVHVLGQDLEMDDTPRPEVTAARAAGVNVSALPVTGSSNRGPKAMMDIRILDGQIGLRGAVHADHIKRSFRGFTKGAKSWRVVATGMLPVSENLAKRAGLIGEDEMPFPAWVIGCRVTLIMPAACLAASVSMETPSSDRKGSFGRPKGRPGVVTLEGRGARRTVAVISLGRSAKVGPGRPEVTILNASLFSWEVRRYP